MHCYRANKSFGTKGKKPIFIEYIVRSPKELTPELLKRGVSVTLINLRTGVQTREKINFTEEVIVRYDEPLSTEEVGRVITEATVKFMSRLQKEVFG